MHKSIINMLILYAIFGVQIVSIASPKNIPDSLQVLHFQVGEVSFNMKRIEGGVFIMGGTKEQHRDPISTDLPTHTVALDSYYLGNTEVTQALWKIVMPEWEFVEELYLPNFPISYVTWYDCQEFIRRLDSITGMPFRLPREAEWEFAARGGNNSRGYRFAGSNNIDSISWGLNNAGFRKHQVGLKHANELGLYDMTGNVSEWCADWYAPYYLGTKPNPVGPEQGTEKIVRGSSFDNCADNSYLSHRYVLPPNQATNYCGLRLALTLPNEPTLHRPKEPVLVQKVKIRNLRIKMIYVEAETPFYISETPISTRIWNKIMNIHHDELGSQTAINKTNVEWNIFLEQCRKLSHKPLMFATQNEVSQALETGLTQTPNIKNKKRRYWEKDTRSIQRHRRMANKAQKWADLVGVKIKTANDPTLAIFTNEDLEQPRWLILSTP